MKTLLSRPMILTAILLCSIPLFLPNTFYFDIAIRMGLVAISVIGLNLVLGFGGQISMGHAAFGALGAYGSAILTARGGVPPVLSIAASICAVMFLAYLFGRPILRLKGHSLTVATLGFGIIVSIVLINEVKWTGGPDGMPVNPLTIGTFALVSEFHWYALVAVLLLLAIALSLNFKNSPVGRALRALSTSEVAAQSSGVDTASVKVKAFVASAGFAALAGALVGHYSGFISPDMSSFMRSVEFATMVIVGGRGSTFGTVLGAVLLSILPQLLGGYEQYEMCAFGLILMLTVIFMPLGLAAGFQSLASPIQNGTWSWRKLRFSK